jgi:hypothetical protein
VAEASTSASFPRRRSNVGEGCALTRVHKRLGAHRADPPVRPPITEVRWIVSELAAALRKGVGAGDGLRTRYLNLGKVALYRVSYSRVRSVPMLPKTRQLLTPSAHQGRRRASAWRRRQAPAAQHQGVLRAPGHHVEPDHLPGSCRRLCSRSLSWFASHRHRPPGLCAAFTSRPLLAQLLRPVDPEVQPALQVPPSSIISAYGGRPSSSFS